jgi:hypothetical protein
MVPYDAIAFVLEEALRTTADQPFVTDVENAPTPMPLEYDSQCDCPEGGASRAYLTEPPTDPGIVFDNPCCEICGEWAQDLPDGFTWQEAA